MRKFLLLLGGGVVLFYFLRNVLQDTLTLANVLPAIILILAVIFHKPITAKLTAWSAALNAKADKMDAEAESGKPEQNPEEPEDPRGVFARWRYAWRMDLGTYAAMTETKARPSDRQLEAFFRDANNLYPGMPIAAIVHAVGPFDSWDDWDRGLWVYEWRRPTVRIRVTTASASLTEVALMDCALPSDFWVEEPVEILWRKERAAL